jgi:hypothetical protein
MKHSVSQKAIWQPVAKLELLKNLPSGAKALFILQHLRHD